MEMGNGLVVIFILRDLVLSHKITTTMTFCSLTHKNKDKQRKVSLLVTFQTTSLIGSLWFYWCVWESVTRRENLRAVLQKPKSFQLCFIFAPLFVEFYRFVWMLSGFGVDSMVSALFFLTLFRLDFFAFSESVWCFHVIVHSQKAWFSRGVNALKPCLYFRLQSSTLRQRPAFSFLDFTVA